MSPTARRAATMIGVALLLVGASQAGFFDLVRDVPRVQRALIEGGVAACVVYVIAFGVFGAYVPGMLLMVPALAWPPQVAIPLGLAGGLLGALHGFVLSRFLAREWVEQRLPPRFRQFDERIAEHGLKAVVVMRLMFFLIPPTHWALGLSKVGLRDYLLGTLLGVIPWVVAIVYIGRNVFAWLGGQPPWVWAIAVAIAIVALLVRRARASTRNAAET